MWRGYVEGYMEGVHRGGMQRGYAEGYMEGVHGGGTWRGYVEGTWRGYMGGVCGGLRGDVHRVLPLATIHLMGHNRELGSFRDILRLF